jgi:hypothetical protein
MEQQRSEMKEFLDDLTTRDQRMMFAVITLCAYGRYQRTTRSGHRSAPDYRKKAPCQFGVLKFQQLDGLNTVMPSAQERLTLPNPHYRVLGGVYSVPCSGYLP